MAEKKLTCITRYDALIKNICFWIDTKTDILKISIFGYGP